MRIPLGPAAIRAALGVALAGFAFVGAFSITGQARQARSVTDGVYTADQAQRGQQLYQAQCVACHGDKLQGVVGPMLTGEGFLGAWGGRSVAELVDKIQNTMPLQSPGTLSRPQSIDITAYLLQVGSFKPGQAALNDAAVKQVTFPARAAAASGAAAGALALTPTANLAQLMRGVTFPNANILFNAQVKDPGGEKPKAPVPFDYVLWGQTVYYGWQAVDQAALALVETAPLFLVPGRRCENGKPVPVDRADWKQYTNALVDLSKEAFKASQSRNVDAVNKVGEQLNEACANCHKVYRDVTPTGSLQSSSAQGGIVADRCNPNPKVDPNARGL